MFGKKYIFLVIACTCSFVASTQKRDTRGRSRPRAPTRVGIYASKKGAAVEAAAPHTVEWHTRDHFSVKPFGVGKSGVLYGWYNSRLHVHPAFVDAAAAATAASCL